jgi:hypothetical protein
MTYSVPNYTCVQKKTELFKQLANQHRGRATKRGKWQFVVKTCRYVRSVAVARPLCLLVLYLKSSVFF